MTDRDDKKTAELIESINGSMITHAKELAKEIHANAVVAYVDVIKSEKDLRTLIRESRCILAARSHEVIEDLQKIEGVDDRIIKVPYMDLTRLSQIKVAAMMGLSRGLIRPDDVLVCLSGSPRYGALDNLMVMDVAREFEVLSAKGLDIRVFVCNFSATCEEVSPWGSLPKGCKNRTQLVGTAAGL